MSLKDQVQNWLQENGYPLEMEVSQAVKNAGFSVVQSEYFEDPETGTLRETDIVAYTQHQEDAGRAIFALVAECKSGKDKPWVLFTASEYYPAYPAGLSVSRRASSEEGMSIMRVLSSRPEIQDSLLFEVPERPGYGLTVALRQSNNDIAYGALMSVSKASLGVVERLTKKGESTLVPFAWPILIIDAPLFEVYLDEQGKIVTSEIDKGLLIWRNPIIANHTIIPIYTLNCFKSEVSLIRSSSKSLLRYMVEEKARRV